MTNTDNEDEIWDEHKTKKGKVTVKISSKEIAEELNKLKNEKDGDLEYEALMFFDKLKQQVAEASGDTRVYDIESPEELEAYMKTHYKPGKAPSGKASLTREGGNSERFDTPEQLMDSLYERGYPRGVSVQTEDGAKARKQIAELFEAWIYGKSWGQMKNRLRDGEHPMPESRVDTLSCSKCRSTIHGYPCPICGYNPRIKRGNQ